MVVVGLLDDLDDDDDDLAVVVAAPLNAAACVACRCVGSLGGLVAPGGVVGGGTGRAWGTNRRTESATRPAVNTY